MLTAAAPTSAPVAHGRHAAQVESAVKEAGGFQAMVEPQTAHPVPCSSRQRQAALGSAASTPAP